MQERLCKRNPFRRFDVECKEHRSWLVDHANPLIGKPLGLTLAEVQEIAASLDFGSVPALQVAYLFAAKALQVCIRVARVFGVLSLLLAECGSRESRVD